MPSSVSAASLARHLRSLHHEADARPTYQALADGIRQMLLDGRISIGASLPSERQLAQALGVSRTTVTAAYAQLRDRRYLTSRQGARSVLSLPEVGTRAPARANDPDETGYLNLDWAAPAAPPGVLHELYQQALESLPHYLSGSGIAPHGIQPLRQAVAQRFCDRGVETTADQILITSGAQAANRLLQEVLITPGDRILVEHPTYFGAVDAIARSAARPVAAPLHPDGSGPDGGWDFDTIERALRRDTPRMMLSLPDFHNPTGLLLPDASRAGFAALTARHRTSLVIDETMCDLALDGPPPTSMAAYGSPADVIILGSMSKTFWPGLRIGWIRADRDLIGRLAIARAAMDLASSVMEQLVATTALAAIDDVIAVRRNQLRESRAAARVALSAAIPGSRISQGRGGISLWVRLPDPLSTATASAASALGVRISPGTRFGIDGSFEHYLRVPYTQPADRLVTAIELLGTAYRSVHSGAAPAPVHHSVLI